MVQHFTMGSQVQQLPECSRLCGVYGLLTIDACICSSCWCRTYRYATAHDKDCCQHVVTESMPWFVHLARSALMRLCQLQLSPMSFGSNLKGHLCVVCASRSPYHQALQALTVKPILRRFPHAPVLALTHTLQLTNPGHGMLQYTRLTPKTHTRISLLSSSNGLTGV